MKAHACKLHPTQPAGGCKFCARAMASDRRLRTKLGSPERPIKILKPWEEGRL